MIIELFTSNKNRPKVAAIQLPRLARSDLQQVRNGWGVEEKVR